MPEAHTEKSQEGEKEEATTNLGCPSLGNKGGMLGFRGFTIYWQI